MKRIWEFVWDEFHMLVLMPIIYIPVAIFSGWWQIIPIFFGAELWSQSWHERQHNHARTHVSGWHWKVAGAAVALVGAFLLRWG